MTIPPLLFALLMWFIGTGAVVWLDSRPTRTFRTSHRLSGVVAVAAMIMVWLHRDDNGTTGAYIGFGAAILIWGWHEMGFLMGFIAGPRREPCPEGAEGWARFKAATATVIHHELAIAANALLLFALCWGGTNQAAPLTFLLLFVLRLSAKFNLFLGVPNLSDEVFPAHLAYLKSYFRKRTMNALFPFSAIGAGGLAWWAWSAAEAAPENSGAAATATLLAGLAVLGLVEHIFLVLPVRDSALWRWADNNRAAKAAIKDYTGEAHHGL
ncbi:putative photosynthetic complex assembly protein PuhE [Sphingomonas sp. AR_OL41]|uniref:putative photosynthetic complex assembly protein PuhE n=1 Tax=Sphingomonas sp. AR_OL41 TaxID=3042729 RepID=UPI00248088AB|nr:putative photosynthetic complex assembly protein PuhE [Sphingomonas sp. AR_OL41]MDH7975344.1 putative photosynthetic complex assembly protein PuhE [Sphingomonas sp. AR_OL41]